MPILSKKVYIASSAFSAFIDRAHIKHDQATAFFRYFAQEQYQLYSDMLTITNAYQKIFDQISPSLSKDFLRAMILGNINVLYPDESDTKAAIKALITYKSTELTFQDSVMSVMAYRKDISQVCTFEYLHPLFGLQMFYLPI